MRVTSLARRLGSTALVLTLGVGLSACNDDSKSADSPAPASDTATDAATDEPSSDEPAQEPEASLGELAAADFYPAVMAAMRKAETFAFSTTTGDEGTETTMSGQARFSDKGMEMKVGSTGADAMEIIMVDKTMYMKGPGLGTGDKYFKIDLSDPNSLLGMIGKATDPESMFKAMETPKSVELLGEEDVDGVATNHYRITIDSAQYMKALDFPEAMAELLPKEMVTEMWVDADNLPRKFSQTTETPSPGGGSPVPSTSEGFYTDFGQDVDIKAPPANQISDEALPGLG